MASRPAAGLFVTGTDTGVGKTVVACALIRGLRDLGLHVAAMKPIETGVGAAGPLDAIALRAAAGGEGALSEICPQQFALPAAPSVAARHEARRVDFAAIRSSFERLRDSSDLVVVEGAGGLRVPIDEHIDMIELALRLEIPALLVARAALGTINHTMLSLEVAAARGLSVIGVVISHSGGMLSDADAANLRALRDALGERLLGEIGPLAAGELANPLDLDLASLRVGLGYPASADPGLTDVS